MYKSELIGGSSKTVSVLRQGDPEGLGPDTKQTNLAPDITGTYISEITSSHPQYFRLKKHRKLVITLEQKGDSITGGDSSTNSNITGILQGNTIKFTFWSSQMNNVAGSGTPVTGEWKVNANGIKLEGSWNSHPAASGKWNLTRIQ